MTIFDLLFIVLFLVTVSTLLAMVWFAIRRQFARVRRVLLRLLVGAAVYFAVVIAVSLILPRRVLRVGEPQCFDDWCVSVDGFKQTRDGARADYTVDFQLSSRARRISQRENNLAVYLTDGRNRRFDPLLGSSPAPFNVLLGPQESVVVSRSFLVPDDVTDVGAVITHEGGFPIGWFIIDYDTWFRKPTLIKLP